NRLARSRVDRGDIKIAKPLELKMLASLGPLERGLELATNHFERLRIEIVEKGLSLGRLVGLFDLEQMIVEPHLGVERQVGAHPVDCSLHLASRIVIERAL